LIAAIDFFIANHYHSVIASIRELQMPATPNAFSVLNHPSLDQSGGGHSIQATRPVPMVESTELLKGSKTVGIMHNGSLYRLQATKLGKLILTK
jgi:hemin uptake protein HemP